MLHRRTRLSSRFLSLALPLAIAAGAGSGCIIYPSTTPGDISFLWSFDGEERCTNAGVQEVLVTVKNGNTTVYEDTVECTGGGVTIRDFDPGTYDVFLDGFDFDDALLYQGDAPVTVRSNSLTDIGVIVLDRLAPVGVTGSVEFTWSFQYPNNDSVETNCDRAGVDEVEVLITPAAGNANGSTYSDTFDCDDDGIRVDELLEGNYDLVLKGYGSYNNNDILLYESVSVGLVVIENDPDIVGDVNLLRENQQFADIDVNWLLPANETCASLGLTDINFNVSRVNSTVVDDAFSVSCDANQTEVRANFVPGSYIIEASALGAGQAAFVGTLTADVAPGSTTSVDVNIVAE